MQANNTFDAAETIKPREFREFTPTDDGFTASLPAKSVVVLELE
jgi:alpha-L-arabinofuranosidase